MRISFSAVENGDTITVKYKNPNLFSKKKFKVDYTDYTNECFVYGLSESCDGYQIPFWAIEQITRLEKVVR